MSMLQTKQFRKVLRSSGVRLTGRTKKLKSQLTGLVATYHETFGIYVTTPAATTPDLNAIRNEINNSLYSQSVDGFSDEILVIQGVTNDTYKPRVWMAEEQPILQAKLGHQTLVAPIIIAAIIIAIASIAVAIAAVMIVNILSNSFTTIAEYILQPPKYVGGTPESPEVYDSWAAYLSSQHNLYWYVCPKCGAGFALKTDYPNLEDVPQSVIDLYNEHVEICLGIPQGPQHIGEFLVYAALGIGGIIATAWVIVKIVTRKES